MAPFDKDPKTSDTPPALSPGVSGVFGPADPIFKEQGNDAGSSAGEFTNLFGKPPKPAPLEGIGTDNLAAGVIPAAPAIANDPALPVAPAQPGSFTMIFGASPVAAKPAPVSSEPLCEPTDGFAKTSVLAVPAKGAGGVTPPVTEARPADKFDSLFPSTAAGAKAESAEPPLPGPPVVETASVAHSVAAPPHNPSEFTMMFGDPARSPAAEDVPKIVALPTSPEVPATPSPVFAKAEPQGTPGSFTQLFGTPAERGTQTPPPSPAAAADATPGLRSTSPEEFASIFNFPLRDSSAPSEPAPKSAPGEFTAMFNSAPVSPSMPSPPTATKDPGAFTKLFNAPAQNAAAQAPTAQAPGSFDTLFSPAPAKPREESFTGIFGTGADATNGNAKRVALPPEGQNYPASNLEQQSRSEAKPPMAMWPPAAPASTPAGSSSGATQIFTRPGNVPAPAPVPPPTGPSAFTQVISGGMVREATQRAAAQAAPPPPPQFVPPGYPPMPAAVPPTMPTAPTMPQPAGFQPAFGQPPAMNPPGMWPVPPLPQAQMPSMQYPQMPQPQMPQPQMPQPSAPPKTNWLPLIIGVNIFVLIVVILIVIFALRK